MSAFGSFQHDLRAEETEQTNMKIYSLEKSVPGKTEYWYRQVTIC